MLSERKEKFKKLEGKIGDFFGKFLTPNQYTFTSLVLAWLCFYFLFYHCLEKALIFFFLAAFLDFIDGAVARKTGKATKKGAYLDTICDRYVEGIVWLGILFLPFSQTFLFLPPKIWIFLAFFGGLMTTYAKAAAKEKELIEKELKKGLIGRSERMILIFSAFILGILNFSWMLYPIVLLAILANLTALERVFLALKN